MPILIFLAGLVLCVSFIVFSCCASCSLKYGTQIQIHSHFGESVDCQRIISQRFALISFGFVWRWRDFQTKWAKTPSIQMLATENNYAQNEQKREKIIITCNHFHLAFVLYVGFFSDRFLCYKRCMSFICGCDYKMAVFLTSIEIYEFWAMP